MRLTRTLYVLTILIATLGLGCGSKSPAGPTTGGGTGGTSATITINIVGMNGAQSYSPNPGTLKVGQTVAWHNADSTSHTATADGGSFNTGLIAPGATSAPITITAVGSFAYHCQIHPTMVGTVTASQ